MTAARLMTRNDSPATKTAARGWAKRAREDLRDADAAMTRGDYVEAWQLFMSASAACSEAEAVAETLTEAQRESERAERDARRAAYAGEGSA